MKAFLKTINVRVKELKVKQATIICQVCEDVINVVDSSEEVKTWYHYV